jgi:glycosyltransferase involved in cell wall biosynthesis
MKHLRILYHHRTQGRGAEGLHIASIVHALREQGHEVTVLSPPGVDPFDPASSVPVDKASVRTRGLQSIWKAVSRHLPNALFELLEIAYNVPAWLRLGRELRGKHYDLVYERYTFYLLAGAFQAYRNRIPFVLEANEVSGIAQRARRQAFPGLCSVFERWVFSRCTAIHAVSSHLAKRILGNGVPVERIHVVPNAFDPARVRRGEAKAELKARLGLQERTTLGFAGWFDAWDRLDFLVDVFAGLRTEHPDIALLLIGDGPVMSALRDQVRIKGLEDDVVFTGPVPREEVYDVMSLLDVAVLAHSNDFGSPVVLFEFMGLGIPIVAPRLEPIVDVLTSGDTALLFDPLDPTGLRKALDRLIRHPEQRRLLAEHAHARLLKEHTWARNASRILASAGLMTAEAAG